MGAWDRFRRWAGSTTRKVVNAAISTPCELVADEATCEDLADQVGRPLGRAIEGGGGGGGSKTPPTPPKAEDLFAPTNQRAPISSVEEAARVRDRNTIVDHVQAGAVLATGIAATVAAVQFVRERVKS